MKKLFIIAALAILADVAMAQTQEKVLYILNGEVASKASVDSLPSGSIRDMNVIKGIEQVVVVNTRDYAKSTVIVKSVTGRKKDGSDTAKTKYDMQDIVNNPAVKSISVRSVQGDASPLYVVKSADGKMEAVKDMKSISPQTIKSVTVIKNEEAKKGFGKFGDTSGGVVLIELK